MTIKRSLIMLRNRTVSTRDELLKVDGFVEIGKKNNNGPPYSGAQNLSSDKIEGLSVVFGNSNNPDRRN